MTKWNYDICEQMNTVFYKIYTALPCFLIVLFQTQYYMMTKQRW